MDDTAAKDTKELIDELKLKSAAVESHSGKYVSATAGDCRKLM